VQSGSVDDVWRGPVDPEAARFLGYATVLGGEAARRVLAAGGSRGTTAGAVALRRSALRVAGPDDPAPLLHGRVLSARLTPGLVRLVVDVAGVGELPAVAEPSTPTGGGPEVGVGVVVPLVVDLTRTARLRPGTGPRGTP